MGTRSIMAIKLHIYIGENKKNSRVRATCCKSRSCWLTRSINFLMIKLNLCFTYFRVWEVRPTVRRVTLIVYRMRAYDQISGKNIHRIEALSDGVFAIALTLLVLDIRVPIREHVVYEKDLMVEFS